MSIQNQYQKVFNVAAGSTVIQTAGNLTVHTLIFPKATAGLVYLTNGGDSTPLFTYPIASIGCHILDAGFASGLAIGANSADAYIVTYQTP